MRKKKEKYTKEMIRRSGLWTKGKKGEEKEVNLIKEKIGSNIDWTSTDKTREWHDY